MNTALHELHDERQLGKALRKNQNGWQTKLTAMEEQYNKLKESKEKEETDLKEQLRDLMFYIEAQNVMYTIY